MSLLRLITGIPVTADSAQVSDVLIWLPSISTMTSPCTNFKPRKKGTKMVIMITIMMMTMTMTMMMMIMMRIMIIFQGKRF